MILITLKHERMKRSIPLLAYLLILFLAVTTHLSAQRNSTMTDPAPKNKWKEIDSLLDEGLIQSVQERIGQLRSTLDPQTQPGLYTKATLYWVLCNGSLSEEEQITTLNSLLAEEKEATGLAKPIIQTAAAELLKLFRDRQYWRAKDRTPTPGVSTDVATWSIKELDDTIASLYLKSISDKVRIREVGLDQLPEIIDPGQSTQGLRPTLYDFLIHRAIDYFQDSRSYLSMSVSAQLLKETALFAEANEFIQAQLVDVDDLTPLAQAIRLYQNILGWRLAQENQLESRLDLDLKRLELARSQSTLSDADERYQKALMALLDTFNGQPGSGMIYYQLAAHYQRQGQNYNPQEGERWRYAFVQAVELAQECINLFPNTYAASRCRALISSIQHAELTMQMEEVLIPGESILMGVTFKNTPALYVRWRECTEKQYQNFISSYGEVRERTLSEMNIIRTESYALPNTSDFQRHQTEVMAEGLSPGRYIVQFAARDDFPMDDMRQTGFLPIQVSSIGFFSRTQKEGSKAFVAFDRMSGLPLANVNMDLYPIKDRLNWKRIGRVVTDENGFAQVLQESDRFVVRFQHNDDVLYSVNRFYTSRYNNNTNQQDRVTFFTDRAIYRPGQTLFFKGIALRQKNDELPQIIPNDSVVVVLYNTNYEEVDRQAFKTNTFGTFNGQFKLPSGGLNGQMHIRVLNGSGRHYFRVEDYKRPTFSVSFDSLLKAYQMEDVVRITGEARTYAGSTVDNQSFTYRVERSVIIPRAWGWSNSYFPRRDRTVQIASGTGKTNGEGQFDFNFLAEPDPSIAPDLNPTYFYDITVVVTDLTGESQEQTKGIRIGRKAYQFDIHIDNKQILADLKMPEFSITNSEGVAMQGDISWRLRRLDAPNKIFRERYWPQPDVWSIDSAFYTESFPNFTYQDELNPDNWAVLNEVFLPSDRQSEAEDVWKTFVNQNGHYQLEVSASVEGSEPIIRTANFSVTDAIQGELPAGQVWWHQVSSNIVEPGDTLVILLGSQGPQKILLEIERDGKTIVNKWIPVTNLATYFYEVQEEDRGNIIVKLGSVYDNRAYTNQILVEVPWSNKKLTIQYETFRDKLRPGQEEEWRLRITGPDQEAVSAEMVATLYDRSLDAFTPHRWGLSLYPERRYSSLRWQLEQFSSVQDRIIFEIAGNAPVGRRIYPFLKWPDLFNRLPSSYGAFQQSYMMAEDAMSRNGMNNEFAVTASGPPPPPPPMEEEAMDAYGDTVDRAKQANYEGDEQSEYSTTDGGGSLGNASVQVRKALDETVFFMPDLRTDQDGALVISFQMKEALTKWVLLGMAHTKDLKYGLTRNEVVTQKELMIQPNVPRFLRQGDTWIYSARISNLTKEPMEGTATLELFDAGNLDRVDADYSLNVNEVSFSVDAQGSTLIEWPLRVPIDAIQPLTHRVIAKAGQFSDGEESTLPVLTNRMLITETHPFSLKPGEEKTVTVGSLASASATSVGQQLTLDYTTNPAWLAVKSMPYLMEFPYDCSEQLFSKFYANTLGHKLIMDYPGIRSVFENWKANDRFESNLTRNQDLKSALNQETPWVMAAQSEAEQQRQIAMLFDAEKLQEEQAEALNKLIINQRDNGAFPWFSGGRDSWFITQYIVAGFGQLRQLGLADTYHSRTNDMLIKAISFLDKQVMAYYADTQKKEKDQQTDSQATHLNGILIHYLFARSMYSDIPRTKEMIPIWDFYVAEAKRSWTDWSIHEQGLLGHLALHLGDTEWVGRISRSLQERAFRTEDLGTYWGYRNGYTWNERPLETHALLMSFFDAQPEMKDWVQDMKVWLLKNKQTNHWKTTTATTAAIYALLKTNGGSWVLDSQSEPSIVFPKGKKKDYAPKIKAAIGQAEAGTGNWITRWDQEESVADLATLRIKNSGTQMSWGSLTWQYFEDLDKITTFEETPLVLQKELFIKNYEQQGATLEPVEGGGVIRQGDELVVRLEIEVDRPMEYIHLKDMRASGLEPIQTLSGYRFQDGLGYYQSTSDLATHFFIDYLPRGKFILEYSLRVTHQGTYSNGISSIQSMYAPEFSSHSAGVSIRIDNKAEN